MTNSPLLRLPGELRTMIFSHAFTGFYVQNPKTRLFTLVNVAHPDILRVSRVVYAECQFLPFSSARFIFATFLIESTVKGVTSDPTFNNGYEPEPIKLKEIHARSKPVFHYSAQVDKIATLHTRGFDFHQISKVSEVLPGLKQIILRPSYQLEDLAMYVREAWLRWDQEKVLHIREGVSSSTQVIFEADDLKDYEMMYQTFPLARLSLARVRA